MLKSAALQQDNKPNPEGVNRCMIYLEYIWLYGCMAAIFFILHDFL